MKQSKFSIYMMIAFSIFFYVYEYLLRNLPGVMVHEYQEIWHFTAFQIGLIDAAYYWAYTPMQPVVGAIVDRFGVRRSLMLSILLCALGCLTFANEAYYRGILMSRFVIGFGSAFAFISVLKLASEWLAPRHGNFIAGLTTALGKASTYGGMTLMSLVGVYLGSDLMLKILALIGIFLLIAVYFSVSDSPEVGEMQASENVGFFEGIRSALLHPQIWLNGFIGGALYLHTMLFSNLWGILFLEKAYAYPQHQAASVTAITFLGWAIGGPLTGYCVSRWGHRRTWLTLSALLSTVVFLVILYVPLSNPSIQLPALLLFLGLVSSPQVLIFPLAKTALPLKYAGSAMSVANMLVMLGGFLGSVVGSMINENMDVLGLQRALMIIPISTSLAFLMSFLLEDKEESLSQV